MSYAIFYLIICTIIALSVTIIDSTCVVKESFLNTKQYESRKTLLWLLSYIPIINGLVLIVYLGRLLIYTITKDVKNV